MRQAHEAITVSAPVRDALASLVRDALGLVFPPSRLAALDRGIASAAVALGDDGADAVLERVRRGDARALDALAVELTVGETYFFRDDAHFAFLRDAALPEVARRSGAIRLWSAGCATGEEAYSLAIAAREALGDAAKGRVEVIGTDLNPLFLERARAGWYGEWSFRDVDPARRARWFVPERNGWRVLPEVRQMVRFERLNLVAPSGRGWPRGVDVIFCRNVTIYFDQETLAGVSARLAGALVDGGWLVPGPSDPRFPPSAGLAASSKGLLVYRRAPQHVSSIPTPSYAPVAPCSAAPPRPPALPAPKPPVRGDVVARARALADANDLVGARLLLDEALRADGLDPSLYLLRSTVRQAASDAHGAGADADRAILLDRSLAFAHLLAATARAGAGEREAALRGLRNARALLVGGPDDALVPHGQGMTRAAVIAHCDRLERSLAAPDDRPRKGG